MRWTVVLLAACTPATTRPSFAPLPEAQVVVLRAAPDRITDEANAWLTQAGIGVARVSRPDGYLETAWHQGAKLRCWVDPAAPGSSRVTIEAVYRPALDPSRTERDLEVAVPADHPGHKVAADLLAALSTRFGASP